MTDGRQYFWHKLTRQSESEPPNDEGIHPLLTESEETLMRCPRHSKADLGPGVSVPPIMRGGLCWRGARRVPRASPGRAGKLSIIGLLVDSHGHQAASHAQHAGSDRSDSVLARHVVFKRRAPVAGRRDTTPRRSSRAATASAMLARLRVQVHALTVDLSFAPCAAHTWLPVPRF